MDLPVIHTSGERNLFRSDLRRRRVFEQATCSVDELGTDALAAAARCFGLVLLGAHYVDRKRQSDGRAQF